MADEWREYRIGEIADIIGGSTPSTSDPGNFNGDIPWLTPKDLSGPHDRYTSRGERNLSRKGLANCSAQLLPPGAVLLSSRAPVGYVTIAKNPIATNQGFRSLVLKPGFEPEFIYYWLKANVGELERHASGSTFKELSGSALAQITIRLPDQRMQRAIAHILGTLDDRIELNRRMNATLEAIARAIFQSWFVDFDPVHARARGEQPPGMDAATAALFPDSFEESELGMIPRGWRVEPIGRHITAIKGLSYSGSGLADQGAPMHNLNSIYEGGGYKYEGVKFYTGDYQERHLLKPGDVIVANTEQGFDLLLIGYAAIVPKRFGEEGLFSHHLYRVRPKQRSHLTSNFIYHLFVSPTFHRTVAGYSNGTTVNMLPPDAMESPLFVVPPSEIFALFDHIVRPMQDKSELNYDEMTALAALRDALLPKLISGEVRVPETGQAGKMAG